MKPTSRTALGVVLAAGSLALAAMALPPDAGAWRFGSNDLHGSRHFSRVHPSVVGGPQPRRDYAGALAERAGFGFRSDVASWGSARGHEGFRLHFAGGGHGRRRPEQKPDGGGQRYRRETIYEYRNTADRPGGYRIYQYRDDRYQGHGYQGDFYRPGGYAHGRKDDYGSRHGLDQRLVQVLEGNRDGESSRWVDGDSESEITVTPTGSSRGQRYCRRYSVAVEQGGRKSIDYGRACREPSGVWEAVQ